MKVVLRAGLEAAVREERQKVSKEWRPFTSLKRFLAEQHPEEWQAISTCGMEFKKYEDHDRPGRFKLLPIMCHQQPFCIRCARVSTHRRVVAALNRFNRCTPRGKKARFIHIVQTAPIYDHGGGWGNQASQDVAGFARVMWDSLVELYGPGIGATMSYHDFGERAFAKRAPHLDLTLNGWMLEGDRAVPTPRYEFQGKGYDRWHGTVVKHARTLAVDAEYGNVEVHAVTVGPWAYYDAMRYQMRELLDLRKLHYHPSEGAVYWLSYKNSRRERMTLRDWHLGFYEYRHRLGWWGDGQSQNLHRVFGHMAKSRITKTERLVGGSEIPHGKGCPCSECGDWDRVFLDEVDLAVGRPKPLKVRG